MENTRTVTPNSAKNSIKHALKKKRPIFLWGAPGIGKSEIVEQICNTFSKLSWRGDPPPLLCVGNCSHV